MANVILHHLKDNVFLGFQNCLGMRSLVQTTSNNHCSQQEIWTIYDTRKHTKNFCKVVLIFLNISLKHSWETKIKNQIQVDNLYTEQIFAHNRKSGKLIQ